VLPLAHHSLIAALPAFGPVLVVCVVLVVHAIRNRRDDFTVN
jgi:hypothetical protein